MAAPMIRASALCLFAVTACRPTADSTAPQPAAPGTPDTPSRHAAGEQIDANVPLASGDVLALAGLRGKVVLLELSDADHRKSDVLADYTRLVETHGERIVIVVVSLDRTGWDSSAAYVLGWDPDGALAAKLHAAALPTVLVLDREGRVAYQYGGSEAGAHAKAVATVERLLAR
jgi:cytochrome oxidase Cu insertion factor (SCO1/SenC/PrrC family)